MLKSDVFSPADGVDFEVPDDFVSDITLIEREMGGVAVSDPSQGINVNVWQSSYSNTTGTVYLKNLDTGITYTIISGVMNMTDLSFAFDANMRPNLGYRLSNCNSYIRYYDTITEAFVTRQLPAGAGAPKLTHDDKRDDMVLLNVTDVMVYYILNNVLYFLVQRERFNTVHQAATLTSGATLVKVGMSNDLRLLVQIHNGTFISSP